MVSQDSCSTSVRCTKNQGRSPWNTRSEDPVAPQLKMVFNFSQVH